MGNLAEAAGQLGKMVEHPNQSQRNPGPRAVGTPRSNLNPPVPQKSGTGTVKNVGPRFRDPISWLPLAMGASSRSLGSNFFIIPVVLNNHQAWDLHSGG